MNKTFTCPICGSVAEAVITQGGLTAGGDVWEAECSNISCFAGFPTEVFIKTGGTFPVDEWLENYDIGMQQTDYNDHY